MSNCQLLANSSSSTILSCKACPDCNILFNHSFFCIVECMVPPTTTVSATTTLSPTTTVPLTTTVLPTTTVLQTIANTTTLANNSRPATTTNTIVTPYTHIVNLNNTVNNNSYYLIANYSKQTQQQFNQEDFIVFLILCVPIVIIVFVILYHCICKHTLKKNRVVIPQDVTIDIADEDNSDINENTNESTNNQVTNIVVKTVLNDLITTIEKKHAKKKLPSIANASKTLKRLQAVKRRTLRKRRDRQLNSLVLRNMSKTEQPARGMRIKEIFDTANQGKKNDYDII